MQQWTMETSIESMHMELNTFDVHNTFAFSSAYNGRTSTESY